MVVMVGDMEIGFVEECETDDPTADRWYGVLNTRYFGPTPVGVEDQTDFYPTAEAAQSALVALYERVGI